MPLSQQPPEVEADRPRRERPLVVLLVLVVFIVAASLALAVFLPRDDDAGANAQAATSVDPATLPASVPFRMVAGHIVVDAVLDEAEAPLTFMLDSGAPVLYAAEVAQRYGSGPVGRISTRAIDGTVVDSDVVAVEHMLLGDAAFMDVAGPVGWVEEGNPLACVTTNGLLGANLMKEAVWQIDYRAESIGIHASVEGLDHVDDAIALEFRVESASSPSPIVELTAADGELAFLLDTGSVGALSVNPADLEAIGLSLPEDAPTLAVRGAGAAGTFGTDLRYASIELVLGDEVVDYPLAVSDALTAGIGNMGNAFLGQFVVTIDWPGRTVYLDPVAEDGSIARPDEPASAGIAWDDGRVVVGTLARGASAEAAGLALGDVVTTLDGVDVSTPAFDDFCALLTRPPAKTGASGTTLATVDGSFAIEVVEGFYD